VAIVVSLYVIASVSLATCFSRIWICNLQYSLVYISLFNLNE